MAAVPGACGQVIGHGELSPQRIVAAVRAPPAVVASGTPREVLTSELLAQVFGVRAAVVDHPLTGDPLIAFDHRAPVTGPRATD